MVVPWLAGLASESSSACGAEAFQRSARQRASAAMAPREPALPPAGPRERQGVDAPAVLADLHALGAGEGVEEALRPVAARLDGEQQARAVAVDILPRHRVDRHGGRRAEEIEAQF